MKRRSMMVLLATASLALAGCGGGGSGPDNGAVTTEAQSAPAVSAEDCSQLGSVVSDFTVGAHADVPVPTALDITAADYADDRDFLAGYLSRAPESVRADVEVLGRWIDGYSTAAESAGVAPGTTPTLDQLYEINAASHLDSREQDLLPPAIQALGTWASGGCTGDRPANPPPPASVTETQTETVAEPTDPLAKAAGDAELGDSVDAVTEAVNEVVHARTEEDEEFLTASADSEIRNCRKIRNLSEQALIAPGGWGFSCEVWRDGRLRMDGAPAIIDVDGRVATAP
jgi:hypothetical protein